MSNQHIKPSHSNVSLTDTEEAVLREVGVYSPEDLLSLVWNFPALGEVGLDLAKLSHVAIASSNTAGFIQTVQRFKLTSTPPPRFAFGANSPPNTPGAPGYKVPIPSRGGPPPGGSSPPSGTLDFRLSGWNVRDQGLLRGTCVAFAMTACREFLASLSGSKADLSEQYLFWATKTGTADPDPTGDGTWIEYARDALQGAGTCESSLWPYQGNIIAGNVTHQTSTDPSAAAHTDAAARKSPSSHFATSVGYGGNASVLLSVLRGFQRPVAISVPVFADPYDTTRDNWNTAVGIAYGRVLDPPPTSIAIAGHAVCVTGFIPDPQELTGGWFIFRNSWGTALWATSLPATPPYYAPEPGYGQISATYIDKFLMEMCCV